MNVKFLQYGEELQLDSGATLFTAGDPLEAKPYYYLVAGLVKIEIPLASGTSFPAYIFPDSSFGIIEPLLNCPRLTKARSMEKCVIYRWEAEGFTTATGVHWELALNAITGLTRMLRILNAEFGERI